MQNKIMDSDYTPNYGAGRAAKKKLLAISQVQLTHPEHAKIVLETEPSPRNFTSVNANQF